MKRYKHFDDDPMYTFKEQSDGEWVKWEDVQALIKEEPCIFHVKCENCHAPHTIEFKGDPEHLKFKEIIKKGNEDE